MNHTINERLQALSESNYKAFNKKIIPTNYEMLGIRIPALRLLAKELAQSDDIESYLDHAEFTTYEHILLYGMVLGYSKKLSLENTFHYFDPLILKFDNWAHVDSLVSGFKQFKKYPDQTLNHFLALKTDEGEFTKRTFVILLMTYFMDERYIDTTLKHLVEVPQGQYYVDMAIAWALSVGLVKFYDRTIKLLEQKHFSKFVHNKAIQKARESYRISSQIKEVLLSIKI